MQVYGYYASGSESEASLRGNREAFARFRLLPHVMVDVSKIDTSTVLAGVTLDPSHVRLLCQVACSISNAFATAMRSYWCGPSRQTYLHAGAGGSNGYAANGAPGGRAGGGARGHRGRHSYGATHPAYRNM